MFVLMSLQKFFPKNYSNSMKMRKIARNSGRNLRLCNPENRRSPGKSGQSSMLTEYANRGAQLNVLVEIVDIPSETDLFNKHQ